MRLQIALIATSPAGEKGSMARYATLVKSSLAEEGCDVFIINLALSATVLSYMPAKLRMALHHIWILLSAPFRLWLLKADIYHIMDGSHAYVAKFIPSQKLVITAHDIIPLLMLKGQMKGDKPGSLGRIIVRESIRNLKRASAVVCVSASTRQDLMRIDIPVAKLPVIHNALEHNVGAPLADWQSRRSGKQPFVFHIGHNGYYKNREAVLRIFASIAANVPDISLKMAGPPPSDRLIELASDPGISDRIEFIESPDDTQVAWFYAHACLFLFPSIYEGFGWPPLEAMASGCPVVCSAEGSLAEVVADAALVSPARNEALLAGHCLDILQNDHVAEELISKGFERVKSFQPRKMANELIEVYRGVAK